jgi:hypothetical protein
MDESDGEDDEEDDEDVSDMRYWSSCIRFLSQILQWNLTVNLELNHAMIFLSLVCSR